MNDLNRSEKIKNYCFLNGQNTKPNNLKLLTIVQIFWISQTFLNELEKNDHIEQNLEKNFFFTKGTL